MMQSPLTQSLMSNPEIFREIFMSNPQMRQVFTKVAVHENHFQQAIFKVYFIFK